MEQQQEAPKNPLADRTPFLEGTWVGQGAVTDKLNYTEKSTFMVIKKQPAIVINW